MHAHSTRFELVSRLAILLTLSYVNVKYMCTGLQRRQCIAYVFRTHIGVVITKGFCLHFTEWATVNTLTKGLILNLILFSPKCTIILYIRISMSR